jgi:hypothetical protein
MVVAALLHWVFELLISGADSMPQPSGPEAVPTLRDLQMIDGD